MADEDVRSEQLRNELRNELLAAKAAIQPQIRGLRDLSRSSISTQLSAEVEKQIEYRIHRRALIQDVLDALTSVETKFRALKADGYPVLDGMLLVGPLYDELTGELSDIEAAASVFEKNIAAKLSIKLGDKADKPDNGVK